MVPAGSMKNPVPERSPCASVPRIFTTALPDFSKISFTSRLMDVVEDSGAWTGAEGGAASSARARATPPKRASATASLEPESCLITHWGTIQHVTRWRRDPVSFGAVFDSTNKRWAKVAGRDRAREAPVRIRQRGGGHGWSMILGRCVHGRGGLINFERNHRGAHDNGCRHGGIRSQPWNIEPVHEILGALQGNPPDGFLQELVALTAMEFVKEILEIGRRRLLIFFEPQKFADLFFA